MSTSIDIARDRQSITWQRHLLTDAMEALGLNELALEPLLSASIEPRCNVDSNETSIAWSWANWRRVEINATPGNPPSSPKTYHRHQRPEAGWSEFPTATSVELTFYADDGAVTRVKIAAPEIVHFGREVEFGELRGGVIPVRLLNATSPARLAVEKWGLAPEEKYRLKGDPIFFPPGQALIRVPVRSDFFGIIAVVKSWPQPRRLIGYTHFNGFKSTPQNPIDGMNAEEFQKLRRWIEGAPNYNQRSGQLPGAEEWLEQWPANSRPRLSYLYEQTRTHFNRTAADAYHLLAAYPTGLSRCLVLVGCGYSPTAADKIIRQLNEGGFEVAIGGALPNLGKALAALSSPAERIWAVTNADNAELGGAAEWARGQGVDSLKRALHLLNRRSDAVAAWEARSSLRSSNVS